MCFGRPSTPTVVRSDPAGDQRRAETAASERANTEAIERTARRRKTALATQGAPSGGTALATYGQSTLGNAL
jgi:hypothetical protein